MSLRSRRWLWLRQAWNLCRPRHSLPAVVGRVRVAAATGHVVGAHFAFGDDASFDSAEYERQLKEAF